METPTMLLPETAPEVEDTTQEPERTPLKELLPRGERAIGVVAVSLVLVVASFASFGFTGHALLGAVFCPVLVLLGAIDFEHKILPNDIIFPAILAVGLIVAAANPGGFLTHLAAAAALSGFFLIFAIVTRGGLGFGDVKLGFLIGLALGWQTVTATMIALAGLLIAALWTLARSGFDARRTAIPFGPFLAIGGILAFFLT